MAIILLLVFALTLQLAHPRQPQIIDFTYTQLLEETNYAGSYHEKIKITPDTQHLEEYRFPDVCELKEKLIEGTDSSGTVDHFINSDDYLQSLRGKILNLLKFAEHIKNSRSYLAEIKKHLRNDEDSQSIVRYKSQLLSLAKKESSLSITKKRVDDLTVLLDKKIQDYNNNPKNEQFKAASLNFQIQNCNSKIIYLKELKEKSISEASRQPHTNFTRFFRELEADLLTQSQQIEFIDKYFQNMSDIKYLKDMADSLRDNIEVDKLNIQYKKSCEREKADIKNKGSSHDQIKETLQHLRQKKKQFGNNTNKYCEGVALKLEMQIKRLLKAINWTFSCADGLSQLQSKLENQKRRLKLIEEQISNYQNTGFEEYQQEFSRTKEVIQSKFQKLRTFTIDQYTHDPAELDRIIEQTEKNRREAEQKLVKLPQQVNGDQTFGQIKKLAEQTKQQKAKFCHEYNLYQRERSKIWLSIYEFQGQIRYASQMRSEYIKQGQKLQELQSEYKKLSELIIKQIEDNYTTQ